MTGDLASAPMSQERLALVAIYKNAVIRHGSAVIRTGTNVAVDDTDVSLAAPDILNWGGRLLPPNNTGLAVGQQYTLVLPEFPPAKIVITDDPDPNGDVPFKGVGAAPWGAVVARSRSR